MNIEQIKKALIEYAKEIYYVDKTYVQNLCVDTHQGLPQQSN
jgi:hypothetical protein